MTRHRSLRSISPTLTAPAVPAAVSILMGGALVTLMDSLGSQLGWSIQSISLLHAVPALVFVGTAASIIVVRKFRRSPLEKRRLLLGVVLSLVISSWITGVNYEARRPPTASLPAHAVREVQGVCRADLRPSSASSRTIPVELTEVRAPSGWTGSAQGQAYLMWEGPEYLTTAGNAHTMVPTRGDTVTVIGAPPHGDSSVIWVESHDIRVEPAVGSLDSARRRMREFVRRRLARLPQQAHTMSLALLLGTRGEMSPEMVAGVRGAGASHVIALSGMHLGVLALLLNKVTARLGAPRVRRIGVAVALCGYVWIAGWIPSLVRALILVGVVLVSLDRDRSVPPEILLSRCVLLTAVIAPGMVAALGFQLSVWALVGLFFVSPRLVELLASIMPYPIAGYIGVTMGPLISTAPISLVVFGTVYPVGLLSAGVLALIAVVLMWSSIAFIILAPVPLGGSLIAVALTAVTAGFAHLSRTFATVPRIDLNDPDGLISLTGWCTLLAAGMGLAIYLSRRRRRALHSFLELHDKPQFDF